jgi:hypothetical protein
MTKLAGFDLVAEVSNEALIEMIASEWKIAGTSASPPFELETKVAQTGVSATAHFIFHAIGLDLHGNDTVTLELKFHNSSLLATAPVALQLSKLDGTLRVTAPVTLVNGAKSDERVPAVSLTTAKVSIDFSAASTAAIAAALTGLPLTVQMLDTLLEKHVTDFIRGLGTQTFPQRFKVVPGKDGSMSRFASLEVHCITDADRKKQALGFFATIFTGQPAGNAALKSTTAIPPGKDVAVTVSANVVEKLLLCPAVAKHLIPNEPDMTKALAQLPTSCGKASGYATKGVTLTSIGSDLAAGHIALHGGVKKSGPCYEASGSFTAEIELKYGYYKKGPDYVYGLHPVVTVHDPDVDVDIDWYCWIAAWAVLGTVGLVATGILNAVGESIAQDLANEAIASLVKDTSLSTLSTPSFSGVDFDTVNVSSDGLTLAGLVETASRATPIPSLALQGSVITSASKAITTGTHVSQGRCPAGTYPFKIVSKDQTAKYRADPTLLGRPLTYTWKVSAGRMLGLMYETTSAVTVPSSGTGSVTIPNVQTHYPQPLVDGTFVQQPVTMTYKVTDDLIELTNVPKQGLYHLWITVDATDPMGQTAAATAHAVIEGEKAEMGGGYDKDLADCLDRINQKLKEKSFAAHQPFIKKWVFPDHPSEKELMELVTTLLDAGLPDTDETLAHLRLHFGPVIHQALSSGLSTSIETTGRSVGGNDPLAEGR